MYRLEQTFDWDLPLNVKFHIGDNDQLDKNIIELVSKHIDLSNNLIEYSNYESSKMGIDKNGKDHFSVLIPNKKCIFTEIDLESFKYKNITDNNTFFVCMPDHYMVFDGSKMYCGSGLKINVSGQFQIKQINELNKFIELNEINQIYETHIDFKKLLYEKVILIDINKTTKVYNSYKKIDYNDYYEKYGNVTDDLIPFIENKNLQENNRFLRKKLIQNVLSKDVCYWIMNECNRNVWNDCPHSNYSTYISIEKIPGVLNFVLFSCHYWLSEVNKLYDMNVKLNVKQIFISKPTKVHTLKNTDDAHIILNIQLDNEGIIDYGEKILMNQGDMFIYNKQTTRSNGNYVLVLFVDFSF